MSETEEAKKVLLGQAKALKMEVDGRWSVETLAEKVLEAQEAKAVVDKAAFEAERKVPVRLLRDAWPVADERHNAGDTVSVPVAMARVWIEVGVAVRADPLPGE